ncbi:MAG TPA: hypothetical protein PLU10_09190 [Chitinophagaceae bacterium]|nr:hypothetical protein [Chitinophagaceae bacterium]
MKKKINLILFICVFSIHGIASNIIISGHIGKEIKNECSIDLTEKCFEFELSILNNSKNDTSFWINCNSWDKHIIQNKMGVISNSFYDHDKPVLYKLIQGETIKFKGIIRFRKPINSKTMKMKFGFILVNANEYNYPKRNEMKFSTLEDVILINWKKKDRVVYFDIEKPTIR